MNNKTPMNPIFISIKEASALIGISVDSIRRLEKNRKFPKRVHLSEKRYGYYYDHVIDWAKSKVADEEESLA